MELKDCKIGLLYSLKQDCGLHKRNSVVKCCGLIEGLKNKDGELRNCIIVKNEERKTHSFIDCSIIKDALLHNAIETMRSLSKDANWGAVGRTMKVLEGEPAKDKPYTDKLVNASKRIFYGIKAVGVNPDTIRTTTNPAIKCGQIQVYENLEHVENSDKIADEINQVTVTNVDDGKCKCSTETIWRAGCQCGGK